MSKASVKMQSWQVFHFARKHLGASVLYSIFGKKNARKVDYWAQNPRDTNKPVNAYDPISGVKLLIETLDDHGHTDVVRSTLSYITSGTSVSTDHQESTLADMQETIAEEIVRDYMAVSDLQRAIEDGVEIEEVEALKTEAINEIVRTVALYRKTMRK